MITPIKPDKPTAEPILSIHDINKIRAVINGKPRDLLLFDLAVETGIGMIKLLRLKAKDLARINVGSVVSTKSIRGKDVRFSVTQNIYETFRNYIKELNPQEDDFLFRSYKGSKPLSLSTVSNRVKGWFGRPTSSTVTDLSHFEKHGNIIGKRTLTKIRTLSWLTIFPFLSPFLKN